MSIMTKKGRFIAVAAACLLIPFMVQAQSQVGTTSAAFLEIPVGARATGMGEAYVSMSDDATSLFWNPAGMTSLGGSQVSFQYTEWFVDTRLNYAAGTFQMGANYLGVHFYMFDGGRLDVTELLYPDGTGEQFSITDVSLGISYARQLTTTFAVGGTFKYIKSSIWRMNASTMALDLGFNYNTPFEGLNLGFAITNFGLEMEMSGDNLSTRVDLDPTASGNNDGILANLDVNQWDLPLIFRLGLNYNIVETLLHSFTVAADAVYPNNNNNYMNIGAEYGFRKMFYLRAGYANLFLEDDSGVGHLRAGFGVEVSETINVDYSWSERGVLGNVNMIGAAIRF